MQIFELETYSFVGHVSVEYEMDNALRSQRPENEINLGSVDVLRSFPDGRPRRTGPIRGYIKDCLNGCYLFTQQYYTRLFPLGFDQQT